jgi:hypothetical protein
MMILGTSNRSLASLLRAATKCRILLPVTECIEIQHQRIHGLLVCNFLQAWIESFSRDRGIMDAIHGTASHEPSTMKAVTHVKQIKHRTFLERSQNTSQTANRNVRSGNWPHTQKSYPPRRFEDDMQPLLLFSESRPRSIVTYK